MGEDASDELVEEVFSDRFGEVDDAGDLGGYVKAFDVFTSPASG